MRNWTARRVCAAFLLLWAAAERGGAATATLAPATYVEEGVPAPGLQGVVVHTDSAPILNAEGAMVFDASLEGDSVPSFPSSVWKVSPLGEMELVAMGSSAEFDDVFSRGFNDAGQVALGGFAPGVPRWAVFGPGPGGPLDLLARTGDPAPGLPSGSVFYLVPDPDLTEQGELIFDTLADVDGEVSGSTHGIWRSDPTTGLQLELFYDDPAPGVPGRSLVSIGSPVVNAAGAIAFVATLAPLASGDYVLFSSAGSGQLTAVAENGGPAPGVPAATVCGLLPLALGDDGLVAIEGQMCGVPFGEDEAIWLLEGSSLSLVAREGEPSAGIQPASAFRSFGGLALGAAGTLVFDAEVAAPLESDAGIWMHRPGEPLTLVARTGNALEDRPGLTLVELEPPAINSLAQVVFRAEISNGGHALLMFSAGEGLQTLVASEDEMVMGPGDVRTVSEVYTQLHLPPGFRILNNAGDVALLVAFEGGGSAAMTATTTVPEAAQVFQLASGAFVLWAGARLGRTRGLPVRDVGIGPVAALAEY